MRNFWGNFWMKISCFWLNSFSSAVKESLLIFSFLIKLLYNEKRALKLFEIDAQDVMAASIKGCNILIQNPKTLSPQCDRIYPAENILHAEHLDCLVFCFTSKWWCQHMSICIKCKHLKTHSSSPLCANPQHFSWRVWWECFMVIGYTQITAQHYTNIEPTHM